MKILKYVKQLFWKKPSDLPKTEQDHYEAMHQDFLKSKPVIIGIDPAKPGADRTDYHQPASRQGKTVQQRFREQGVAAMAAARRGEVQQTARRETKLPVQSGMGYPARSSSQSTTVFNAGDTNLWVSNWGSSSDTCDSSSSDSSSSDCSCGSD